MIDDIERMQIRVSERQKAFRRHGIRSIGCTLCPENDPLCFYELDHHDGQKYSDNLMPLCKNCHSRRTSRQLTENPKSDNDPKNDLEKYAQFLLNVSHYLEFIIVNLLDLADVLQRLAKRGINNIRD